MPWLGHCASSSGGVLALGDQRRVVAEDAGMALDLAVRQVRLRDSSGR